MQRLEWNVPSRKEKVWASAITSAAIRLHVPLVPAALLVLRLPWLPGDATPKFVQAMKKVVLALPLHPIIADFYAQNLRVVRVTWPSVGRLLVNVYRHRKKLGLHVAPCA